MMGKSWDFGFFFLLFAKDTPRRSQSSFEDSFSFYATVSLAMAKGSRRSIYWDLSSLFYWHHQHQSRKSSFNFKLPVGYDNFTSRPNWRQKPTTCPYLIKSIQEQQQQLKNYTSMSTSMIPTTNETPANEIEPEPRSRAALRMSRRVLIKAGTSVVANDDGSPSLTRLGAIVEQIAELNQAGVEVIFVSSGAVGM
jgi:hypothetical protein